MIDMLLGTVRRYNALLMVAILSFLTVYEASIQQTKAQNQSAQSGQVRRIYLQAVNCYCGNSAKHGNVWVEYTDGRKVQMTTSNMASNPQLSADGHTFGWAEGHHFFVSSYQEYWLSQENVICYRDGKRIFKSYLEPAYRDDWKFVESGQIVRSSVGKHGLTSYQLLNLETGEMIQTVHTDPQNAPPWARFPNSGPMPPQRPEVLPFSSLARRLKPGENAAQEARFLKAVRHGDTFARIQKLLPATTRYSIPRFQCNRPGFLGNVIEFSGPISGCMSFISKKQMLKIIKDKFTASETDRRFSYYMEDDQPVDLIQIIVDNGNPGEIANGKRRIEAYSRYLGKPAMKEQLSRQKLTDARPSSWFAQWQLDSGSQVMFMDRASYSSQIVNYIPAATLTPGVPGDPGGLGSP